jgi:hypothetical protein
MNTRIPQLNSKPKKERFLAVVRHRALPKNQPILKLLVSRASIPKIEQRFRRFLEHYDVKHGILDPKGFYIEFSPKQAKARGFGK